MSIYHQESHALSHAIDQSIKRGHANEKKHTQLREWRMKHTQSIARSRAMWRIHTMADKGYRVLGLHVCDLSTNERIGMSNSCQVPFCAMTSNSLFYIFFFPKFSLSNHSVQLTLALVRKSLTHNVTVVWTVLCSSLADGSLFLLFRTWNIV